MASGKSFAALISTALGADSFDLESSCLTKSFGRMHGRESDEVSQSSFRTSEALD